MIEDTLQQRIERAVTNGLGYKQILQPDEDRMGRYARGSAFELNMHLYQLNHLYLHLLQVRRDKEKPAQRYYVASAA